jgi:hypothetical protein
MLDLGNDLATATPAKIYQLIEADRHRHAIIPHRAPMLFFGTSKKTLKIQRVMIPQRVTRRGNDDSTLWEIIRAR